MLSESKRSAVVFVVILLIGVAIRAVFITPDVKLNVDSQLRYDPIARNLILGNGFSTHSAPPFVPNGFDQPGYPLFLAAAYRLFSYNLKAVVLLQFFLEAGILFLIVCILNSLGYSRRVKLAALCFGSLCPFLPMYSALILTEIPATFFITLTCYFFLQAAVKGDRLSIGCAGLAGGISLLVRADLVIVVGLMLMTGIFVCWRLRRVRGVIDICLVCAAIIVVLIPWTVRNYYHFQKIQPLGGVTEQVGFPYSKWLGTWLDDFRDYETYWWRGLDAQAPHELPENKISADERLRAESALLLAKQQGSFDGRPNEEFLALTQKAKEERPLKTFVGVPLRRAAMAWYRMPTYIQYPYALKIAAYMYWLAMLSFTVLGMIIIVLKGRSPLYLFLFAVICGRLALPLISPLGIEPRYMLEALPICFIFSAIGFSQAGSRIISFMQIFTAKPGKNQ